MTVRKRKTAKARKAPKAAKAPPALVAAAPAKTGRPSIFSLELGAAICGRMSAGESVRKICADEHMPDATSVYLWLSQADPEGDKVQQAKWAFSLQYARAAEDRAHHLAEEALEIADDTKVDFSETKDGPKFNPEHVQRSRLRVDTRKWFAGKLAPKKYGEKVHTELSGPDGGPVRTEGVVRPPITRAEWLALYGGGGAAAHAAKKKGGK